MDAVELAQVGGWAPSRERRKAATRAGSPTPVGVGNNDYDYCLIVSSRLQLIYIMEIC